jgi:hypothetical protein
MVNENQKTAQEFEHALKVVSGERDRLRLDNERLSRSALFVRTAIAQDRWHDPSDAAILAERLHTDPVEGLQLVALKSPHLLRSKTATQEQEPNNKNKHLETLFGSKSNSKIANDLALKDNAAYLRLRAEAQEIGLIG